MQMLTCFFVDTNWLGWIRVLSLFVEGDVIFAPELKIEAACACRGASARWRQLQVLL